MSVVNGLLKFMKQEGRDKTLAQVYDVWVSTNLNGYNKIMFGHNYKSASQLSMIDVNYR